MNARLRNTVIGLVAGLATVVAVAPAPAQAAPQSVVVNCTTHMGNVGGHAKMRNCTIAWSRDLAMAEYWQTIKFELLDSATDGHCARGEVVQNPIGDVAERSKYASSCNGLWQPKQFDFAGRADYIWIGIGYGSTNGAGGWVDYLSNVFYPPAGY